MLLESLVKATMELQGFRVMAVTGDAGGLVAELVPDLRFSPRCGQCGAPGRYRDTRGTRRFRHVPLWGIADPLNIERGRILQRHALVERRQEEVDLQERRVLQHAETPLIRIGRILVVLSCDANSSSSASSRSAWTAVRSSTAIKLLIN